MKKSELEKFEDDIEDKIISQIKEVTKAKLKKNEPMKNHTTFKIGGNADIYAEVTSVADLKEILKIAKKEKLYVFILGNGSNLLVREKGIRGIVIKINFDSISIDKKDEDYYITAYAGASLNQVIRFAMDKGVGDISKLYGIPGSIGGVVRMNAGAYGLEMKDVICETTYMDYDGNLHKVKGDKHNFGYRTSVFKYNNGIIICTTLKLKKVDKEKQIKEANEILNKRKTNQPLNYPSAGSTFKRGIGYIASLLIDNSGLKGTKVGGAEVSTKHAGFIINKSGDAKAKDVLDLVKIVQDTVKEKTGKNLELEVVVVGE